MTKTLAQLAPKSFSAERNSDGLDTGLIRRHRDLANRSLDELSTEDLRFLIVQKSALEHLIPLALSLLEGEPLASGDHYTGDLLNSVLDVPTSFWEANTDLNNQFVEVLQEVRNIYRTLEDLRPKLDRLKFR